MQSKIGVLSLMAGNFMVASAIAQPPLAQAPERAQNLVNPGATNIQVNGVTEIDQASRPPGAQDETKAVPVSATGIRTETEQAGTKKEEKEKKDKRGEIVVAPPPTSSPALGTGIIPVFGYIFPFNKKGKAAIRGA